jgi:DNA replication protein DnaC
MSTTDTPSLDMMLRSLKLPSFVALRDEMAKKGQQQGWSFEHFLSALAQYELAERKRRRITRLLRGSCLPPEKTLATLKLELLPTAVRRLLPVLCEGNFADKGENLLAFGLPGRGKTHLVAAIGHELVMRGFSVLFVPAYALVQRLLSPGTRNRVWMVNHAVLTHPDR